PRRAPRSPGQAARDRRRRGEGEDRRAQRCARCKRLRARRRDPRRARGERCRTARRTGRHRLVGARLMADDDKKSTALVRPGGSELALERPMIASDLDRAGKGQLVYVGRDGEVKNPATVRNRQVAAYVTFGGITAAGVALAASSFPVLVPFYLVLGGRFLGTGRAVKRVNEASVALSRGAPAPGRALAEPVTRAWWAPSRVRALAELRVAI